MAHTSLPAPFPPGTFPDPLAEHKEQLATVMKAVNAMKVSPINTIKVVKYDDDSNLEQMIKKFTGFDQDLPF